VYDRKNRYEKKETTVLGEKGKGKGISEFVVKDVKVDSPP